MEKFGIFELLDTLSAIVDRESADTDGETQPSPTADSAFLPPVYGNKTGQSALTGFLSRHDEMVKRIDKKK